MKGARVKLLWRGDGRAFLPGVPARDLETDDPSLIARALASGLYRKDRVRPARKQEPATQPVESPETNPAEQELGHD